MRSNLLYMGVQPLQRFPPPTTIPPLSSTDLSSLPSAVLMDSSLYTPGTDLYMDPSKQQFSLDLLFSHTDIPAGHPSLVEFESEIDSSLEGFAANPEQLKIFTTNDYPLFRPGFATCGPPSAFTESAYESSTVSDSAYNPSSPNASTYSYADSTYSSLFDLDSMTLDFQHNACVDDYSAQPTANIVTDAADPTSFGALPPTPPRSPPAAMSAPKAFMRSSYPDYTPPARTSLSTDFYPQITFGASPTLAHSTVSPINISAQLPSSQPILQARSTSDAHKSDPKKKHKCPHCPRAFARAYNLKTHKTTHDPHRPKPHVCPYRSCGRSFSRKHDLGRHLVSLHRDESFLTVPNKKAIGVERAHRSWCDNCGKSSIGRNGGCECHAHDIK